jgi:beta-lactamase regulating signal transducer with metallopeptidase domain
MESFIIYIAKAAGLLTLFFIAYYLLLRKETFFTSNRGFLLAGLLTSALLPLAEYTRIIFVAPAPQMSAEQLQPIDIQQYLMMQQLIAAKPEPFTINWYYVAIIIYAIGALFFLTRFIMDFMSIRRILKDNKIIKEGKFRLIDSEKVQSPFSFFNYIVYNSAVLQPEELESIISHEKVHSCQRHSADMIISQLFCIAFWFNPFVWLYKKSISQNLEFIADAVAIKQLADKRTYQRTLLKITLQPECIAITNHFYQSLIKKRIVMLNKKQSKRRNSWKYSVILPALAAFIFLFQVKVVAQEKAPEISSSSQEKTKISIAVDKDATDADLAKGAKVFKEEFAADVTFSNVIRNTSGEITGIKVTVKDKTQSQDHYVSGATPIKPFSIEMEKDTNSNENTIAFSNPNHFSITGDKIDIASADAAPTKTAKTMTCTSTCTNNGVGYSGSNTNVNINKDALVIVNGVQQKDENNDFHQLQLPKGQAIGNMRVLSAKEAKKKYGKAGKKGAVEIDTKVAPSNFAYTFDNNVDMPIDFKFNMPDMDQIMILASNGVNVGMDVLANMDWQKTMDFQGISEEERKEIQEEMKKAQVEVKKAMNEAKIEFDKEKYMETSMKTFKENGGFKEQSMKDAFKEMEEAKLQMKEAQKQLEAAQKELQKAQKEIEKKKALSKKS